MFESYVNILLLVSGLATCSAILQFIAPVKFTPELFEVDVRSSGVLMLSRHWSLLAFLVGCLLLSAIWMPELIPAAMIIAAIEKFFFASFLMFGGARRTAMRMGFALSDYVFVILFAYYLLRI